ncbi:hypothetical protein NMG60_11000525 [Bertholletia excelsa]
MSKELLSALAILLILFGSPGVLAQSPAKAPAAQPPAKPPAPSPPAPTPPAPSPPAHAPATPKVAPAPKAMGPPNITAILEKAGHFSTLIRLLKSSQQEARITEELNKTSQGLTILAPSDKAFGNLKLGTLNSFNDNQKVQLAEFHILPNYLTLAQFQTVSNPVLTEAGDTSKNQFPLNVITSADQANISLSSGIVNTTISDTVYTDGKLAVYEVDNVLLPMRFFVTPSPAPAPSVPMDKSPPSSSGGSITNAPVKSGATGMTYRALDATFAAVFIVALFPFCL